MWSEKCDDQFFRKLNVLKTMTDRLLRILKYNYSKTRLNINFKTEACYIDISLSTKSAKNGQDEFPKYAIIIVACLSGINFSIANTFQFRVSQFELTKSDFDL